MGAMASQITGLTIVYSTVYSGVDQRKHQSSASLAFVRGILRWPVNSPHKWPVTRKIFPFDDVIMELKNHLVWFPSLTAKYWQMNWISEGEICLSVCDLSYDWFIMQVNLTLSLLSPKHFRISRSILDIAVDVSAPCVARSSAVVIFRITVPLLSIKDNFNYLGHCSVSEW